MERPTEEALSRAVARLAARDASLFADPDIATDRLGWLGLAAEASVSTHDMRWLAEETTGDIDDVVLIGMGGSSLAPLVLARVIGPAQEAPALHVLDTTDAAEVAALLDRLDPVRTLVVVSSKSGTTIETASLEAVFWEWASVPLGAECGRHFLAITDPGSPLEDLAHARAYARVVHAPSDVGGRFGAFTPFATAPAAMIGIDLERLIAFGKAAEGACHRPGPGNPGQALASFLLDAYADGRDKLTLAFSPSLEPLGLWIEQLVAESTGKGGRGILPVVESPLDGHAHGPDRMTFVLRTAEDRALADLADALPAGEPLFETVVEDVHAIGAQFVLWEWAVTLFCALAGIEPFDQPDVESAKQATRAIVAGGRPDTCDAVADGPLEVRSCIGRVPSGLGDALGGLLDAARPGSYLALLAYLPEGEASADLSAACARLAAARRIPFTFETGPRYLHSTGQYHKGGPDGGLFLVVSARDARDLPVPGEGFTLGELHRAQADGDVAALASRGRTVVSVTLPDRSEASVGLLLSALESLS